MSSQLEDHAALDNVLKTEWTLIHERGSMIPVLTGGSLFVVFPHDVIKTVGRDFGLVLMIYQGKNTTALFPRKDYEAIGRHALERLVRDPAIIRKHHNRFLRQADKAISQMKAMEIRFLSGMPKKDILSIYKKYFRLYYDACLWGEPFPLAVHQALYNHLDAILSKAIADFRERQETFTKLISPTEPSFMNRQEMAFRKLVQYAKKKHPKIISKKDIAGLIDATAGLKRRIDKHISDYY